MVYDIYAGLKEPYGKVEYVKTSEYESLDHALQDARDEAYYKYKNSVNVKNGFLPTYGECLKEAELSNDTVTEEDIINKANYLYCNYIEQCTEYFVRETSNK